MKALPQLPYVSTSFLVAWLLAFSPLSAAQDNLADIIDRAEKSVVRIEVKGIGGDSLGSGFLVESNGLLVTNVHVLAGAERAKAFFRDGTGYEIRGTFYFDENRDVCVAKIDVSDMQVIPLSRDLPRKGEQVVALGSPHGLSFSATRGIVSAIRQEEEAKEQLGRPNIKGTWIQVDAALSGGNSGGPLINTRGQVVAMSTLASQGAAQNLNFGISVMDIQAAVDKAKKAPLLAFEVGVGKVDMEDVVPESAEIITRGEIPARALNEYIEQGRSQYSELARDLKKAATEAQSKLTQMRKGQPYGSGGVDVLIQVGRNIDRYFFRNEAVKDRVVAEQRDLSIRLNEVKRNLQSKPDDESVFTLLMNSGPRLDPRKVNEVGFMQRGIVLHAINEHDIVVLYDELPYMMWVKSTAGLATGQEVTPGPVYVAGTETVFIPGQGSASLTILNSVTETEMRNAVFGESAVTESDATRSFRNWTDVTGQFSVEAILVEVGNANIILKTREGNLLTVPLEKLSKADAKLIGK